MKLGIDIETFSPENLKLSGLYRYALNPEFDILLFGYSLDGEAPVVLDCTKTNDRLELMELAPLIYNPGCIKTAYNAAFEWYCLSVYLNRYKKLNGLLPIDQWRDTQLAAQYCGYPTSLEDVGRAMQLPEDKKKLATGKTLIRLFCSPRKPTKRDQRTRIYPEDEPEKWELFKMYNAGDVISEQEIARRLEKWPVPDFVQKQWELDTLHNAMGVNIDMKLVNGAISIADRNTKNLLDEAAEITGLDNPNSRDQLKDWLTKELPEDDVPDMKKDTVSGLLKNVSAEHVKRVLEIRQETGKAAHKKYARIKSMVCADGRVRGMMKFYGANRTGRWASVGVQLQNLARTHVKELDFARSVVEAGDLDALKFCYGAVSDTLGQLVRTALIPSPGHVFVDADFSAIEARVIAWLAGEEWVLEVFRTHGKIYEATASQMFGVPMEKIKKGNPEYELRQRGKVATLACIAEGSLVPVKFKDGSVYEIPIQLVTSEYKVWDGNEWVSCDGAVFNGYREVITYEGLTATPDHLVWVEGQDEPIPFWIAAQSGSHLAKSGKVRFPVWMGKNHKPRTSVHQGMVGSLRSDGVSELARNTKTVRVYDIRNAGPSHRYAVQGVLVHNCGYQGGAHAMETMDINHAIDPELYPGLVKKWRQANPAIVKYWYDTENAALETLRTGQPHKVRYCTYAFETDEATGQWFLTCLLPSGRKLFYVRPTICENRFGKQAIRFWGVNDKKKWGEIDTYGGRLVENCVSGEALVLTQRGLVRLKNVCDSDMLWDGIEYVHHKGLLQKGKQYCICVNGVYMTPDHKILTEGGWVCASSCEGHNGPAKRVFNCGRVRRERREKVSLESTLRLRYRKDYACKRIFEGAKKILRVQNKINHLGKPNDSRNEQNSILERVALYAAALRISFVTGLEKLRGPWNNGMPGVGRLREFLQRHVRFIQAWPYDRKNRREQGILQRELQMDTHALAGPKQAQQSRHRHASGKNDDRRSIGTIGDRPLDPGVPCDSQLADSFAIYSGGYTKQSVYDIMECGPRNRFTVMGENGLMIVHNCCQAVARDCLAEKLYPLEQAGYPVVFSIHDEIIADVPESYADLKTVTDIMSAPISWAPGLPLNAEGWVGKYFKKD